MTEIVGRWFYLYCEPSHRYCNSSYCDSCKLSTINGRVNLSTLYSRILFPSSSSSPLLYMFGSPMLDQGGLAAVQFLLAQA